MAPLPRPILAVHQPNYAPWLGWFLKAAAADTMVLLDDVQFPKGSWVNRTRVLAPGGPEYLSVPVRHPGLAAIAAVRVADPQWPQKHRRRLEAWYHCAPGLDAARGVLAEDGLAGVESLADANEVVIRRLADLLGVGTTMVRSSTLGIDAADPTGRHLALCQRLGARTYLSGRGAAAYNDEARFREAGIALAYLAFDHPLYPQGEGEFVEGLSTLDFLCRTGEEARDRFAAARESVRLEPTAARPSG